MITKSWKANRPRGLEYENEWQTLALIQWQWTEKIWEHDVLRLNKAWYDYFYIAIYQEDINVFIAYPLCGHMIKKTHIDKLEIYENIFDFYMKYEEFRKWLPIKWPYKTFVKNLEFYLNNAGYSIYR